VPENTPVEPDLGNASAGILTLPHPFGRISMLRKALRASLFAAMLLATFSAEAAPRLLRVLTHSSFAVSPEIIAAFEKANDVKLQFSSGGDAGETLNKAILTKGNPLADVIFGVDNTFLGRALAADILEPMDSAAIASIPLDLRLDPSRRLVPIDYGYVTLNYDRSYFKEKGLALPATLEDLTKPAYRGLLVVENPATSSPGLAFLIATIAWFGETGARPWESYWKDLRGNDVLAVNGWDDAYYNEFSASGKGKRPIVVSYATSPAAELWFAADPKPAEPPTANLLAEGASFRQVEFAGVLKGAREPELARRFVAFMLSPRFQADIPLQMWVYPSDPGAPLPEVFTRFAPIPPRPALVDPLFIDARRDDWIQRWTRIVLR
jgi:thiamine transport system substrate-binding protein